MNLLTHEDIGRLTPPERLALIAQLWDSLESNQMPLSASQQEELDRRLQTLDQDRSEGVDWEDLKSELDRRHP